MKYFIKHDYIYIEREGREREGEREGERQQFDLVIDVFTLLSFISSYPSTLFISIYLSQSVDIYLSISVC